MNVNKQLFTAGFWTVRPGKEAEFIRAWDDFAHWTSRTLPGAGDAYLLQDVDKPNRFLSAGPWDSAEDINEWRSMPEFKEFIARARELCEEVQPVTMKQVALSSSGIK